ncbi:hypothetical protein [Pedobacter panaciterrae]
MYTVYHNSLEEGYSYYSFHEQFINICKDHKKSGRALAFAFILYDFENPQISKVLNDRDYWLALHEMSGRYLTVFSIHYKEVRRVSARSSDIPNHSMSYLTGINTLLKPNESTDEIISKYFNENLKVSYPSVLFFQVDDNKVIDSLLVELYENSIESVFQEMKEYISAAVLALKKISPDNYSNHKEMFDQVENRVGRVKSIKKLKRYQGVGKSVVDFGLAIASFGN